MFNTAQALTVAGRRLPLCWPLLLLALLPLAACNTAPKYKFRTLPADATVLAFGDSLTFGVGVSEAESYPAVLGRLIGRKVVRSGVPGETSAAGLERLPEELARHRPALLLLCLGGNDTLRRIDPQQTFSNLREMVTMALKQNIQVVLIGVPQISFGLTTPKAASLYYQLAAELKLPLEGEVLSEMLYDRSYKSDSVHLNAAGYRRLATTIAEMLKAGQAV